MLRIGTVGDFPATGIFASGKTLRSLLVARVRRLVLLVVLQNGLRKFQQALFLSGKIAAQNSTKLLAEFLPAGVVARFRRLEQSGARAFQGTTSDERGAKRRYQVAPVDACR